MEYKDYYKVLGVDRTADTDAIKRAYRKLARKYHPDVSKESDAEARFKEVQEAYEVLHDPEKRQAYDNLGNGWQSGQGFKPPPDWQHREFHFEDDVGAGEFSDFFEQLFGHSRRGHGGSFKRPGRDHHARLRISLEEAYRGGTRSLTLTNPEIDAQGHVRQQQKEIKVQIPPGVLPGQHIRLRGQGETGIGGGPTGDLLLQVEYEPHRLFRAEGRDIHLELPVTPWEAALGAKVAVPTLGGKVNLTIPSGSQTGKRLRLKGRGLPGKSAGDQIVTLSIMTPEPKTAAQRALYEQMREQMPLNPRAQME